MIDRHLLAAGLACLALLTPFQTSANTTYWNEVQTRPASEATASLATYRYLHLDQAALETDLRAALREGKALSVPLPLSDGRFAQFTLADSGTMAPELAAKFPELLSLAGHDDEGRRVRVDISPRGLAAMVFDEAGITVIQPELPGSAGHLIYARSDHAAPSEPFHCEVHNTTHAHTYALPEVSGLTDIPSPVTTGRNRRVYRLAQAATGEYTAAVCAPNLPSVSCGLAAIVTTINRVNQVYENDLGVQMQLIGNTNLLIYTNGSTDPYTNNNGSTMLTQNQNNITTVIGSANYDIGHVFSTGGGGIAGLRVICNNSRKAEGVTGSSQPWNDPFDIDYVAHEMGHQFGGSHTFNGTASSCGGGNRSGGAAYEPGSGSTIQAYAGICGTQNLQANSDPYFHAISLQEMDAHIRGSGGNCAVTTTPDNTPPVITSISTGHTIPARTPFALDAEASDVDGSNLTYTWEQWDLGAAQSSANPDDNGTRPILRSYTPTLDSQRVIPRLSMLLNNPLAADKGELLPTTTRTLKFRLTVRDNAMPTGASSSANATLNVVNTGEPFAVTSPGTSPAPWLAGQSQTVTWNVAGTDAAPISCPHVRIDLSDDGGINFAHELTASTPNTGSADVIAPMAVTTEARIRVACANNIFFNLSPADFSIEAPLEPHVFSDGFED